MKTSEATVHFQERGWKICNFILICDKHYEPVYQNESNYTTYYLTNINIGIKNL